jgi:hypothetical protein
MTIVSLLFGSMGAAANAVSAGSEIHLASPGGR